MEKKSEVVLKPLEISCDTADCGDNLHCFRKSKPQEQIHPLGTCKYCGADLIDWDRIHLKTNNDINYTFNSLKKEWIRHKFWHVELPMKAVNYALRKGKKELKNTIYKRIETAIGSEHPFHDGYQTPFDSDNPIYYAQHATATCCRKCVEYWYNIELTRSLTHDEKKYFTELILKYLEERITGLTDEKQKIPPIRKK